VQPADVADRDGAREVLERAWGAGRRLQKIWVDQGYRGELLAWAKERLGTVLEVVQHAWAGVVAVWTGEGEAPPARPAGFQVLPWRWVVERTFAWLGLNRRLSKDYEYLPETSEAMVQVAMVRLMLRRLARDGP